MSFNTTDQTYLLLLSKLLRKAKTAENPRPDRTTTGTYSLFGEQLRFDLAKGFPLLTTKKVHLKSVIHELLWFLSGEVNIDYLNKNGVRIWDEWADSNGNLGPIYGAQWRQWIGEEGIIFDQIAELMRNLEDDPYSRRHIVSAWAVHELPLPRLKPSENPGVSLMALAPCHTMWQVYVDDVTDAVSLHLYQRSADIFLGVPFNIASYALLTHMIAHQLGRPVGELIISFGDVHLYANHIEQAETQLQRQPNTEAAQLKIVGDKPENLWSYCYENFEILDYDPYPAIPAPVSV